MRVFAIFWCLFLIAYIFISMYIETPEEHTPFVLSNSNGKNLFILLVSTINMPVIAVAMALETYGKVVILDDCLELTVSLIATASCGYISVRTICLRNTSTT